MCSCNLQLQLQQAAETVLCSTRALNDGQPGRRGAAVPGCLGAWVLIRVITAWFLGVAGWEAGREERRDMQAMAANICKIA